MMLRALKFMVDYVIFEIILISMEFWLRSAAPEDNELTVAAAVPYMK
jgi:hypothetical protein